ncbi:MAG: LytR C-terminal domain-containing protein [Rhodococcus sp.]|uniref:LytR C-terminal domain-containing protein n=1 Tax=Rhodococcus sp. TaxID=1831 RepID=UPI0016A38362|nr:LytR C-terminal domain-containing protein [Rhodococcus sp. (in: high G+C Gram-positive bacteria)]NLV77902.1 LytR C-terminal domain-containing protein [Rhodococcus sp. (in: high G+C Gram-positive bacteria)]
MVGGVSRTDEHVNRQPKSSGPPLRAFAMVLISLAILFAGLGFASMGGSDESASAAATTDASGTDAAGTDVTAQEAATSSVVTAPRAATTTTAAAATTTASGSDSLIAGAPESAAPVRIYNNSEIAGLAAQTASLLEDEGFVVSETGNYSDGLLAQTSVFYGTGAYEQVTAEAVAAALGVTAQPRFDGIVDAEPGVIVIVTSG